MANIEVQAPSFFRFICANDIAPESKEDFAIAISNINSKICDINKRQREIDIYLHAREARLDKISKRYATWKEALSELASDIEACRTRITQQSEKLPALDDPEARLGGWRALSELEQHSYHLRRKNKVLLLLLNSPEHKKTLKLCKDIIKECEQVKELSSLPLDIIITKVEKQIASQQETLANCKAPLKQSIIAINQDILDFLTYVAKSKNPEDEETQKRLQKLIPNQKPHIDDTELTTDENRLINSFTDVILPNERYFKCGIIMADWRYPTIYPIIDKMQKAAQGLQQVEIDLTKSIKAAWQGKSARGCVTASESKQIVEQLELILRKHKEALLKIPFCEEVHAGFHYAASLFSWIGELASQIDFLSKITQDPWLGVCKLQQLFYRQLELFAERYTHQERVTNLYEIITNISPSRANEHSFFENYKHRITTTVIASIGSLSSRLLSLSSDEVSTIKSIGRRSSLSWNSYMLPSLMSKKIINCLYVTGDAFDIELELILTILKTVPKYCIDTTLTKFLKNEHLSQLLAWYKNRSHIDEVEPLLTSLSEIFYKLNQTAQVADQRKEQQDVSLLYHFSACTQKLFDAQQSLQTQAEKSRYESFLKLIENLTAAITKKYRSPTYSYDLHSIEIPEDLSTLKGTAAEQVVYKLVLQAYWSQNEGTKVAATQAIQQIVDQPQLNFMSDQLKNLLKTLAFGIFLTPDEIADITPLEQTYLPPLLKQHLEQPDFWIYLFPIGTLEEALYKVLHEQNASAIATDPRIREHFESFTQNELYPTWEGVIRDYLAFRNLTDDKKFEKDSTEALKCRQYLDTLNTIRKQEQLNQEQPTRYKYIFKMLYKEMKKMLDDSLS